MNALISLLLALASVRTASGTIVDVNGNPIPGATVQTRCETSTPAHTVITDFSGRYSLVLPQCDGSPCFLIASLSGFETLSVEVTASTTFPLPLTVSVSEPVDEVTICICDPVIYTQSLVRHLQLQVRDPNGAPLAGVLVIASGVDSGRFETDATGLICLDDRENAGTTLRFKHPGFLSRELNTCCFPGTATVTLTPYPKTPNKALQRTGCAGR